MGRKEEAETHLVLSAECSANMVTACPLQRKHTLRFTTASANRHRQAKPDISRPLDPDRGPAARPGCRASSIP